MEIVAANLEAGNAYAIEAARSAPPANVRPV
jgi:hypothetical protein